jgi:hypothetical protein
MKSINSFDIFDTLLARRCVSPSAIFKLVEKKSGLRDFVSIRTKAEQKTLHKDYNLEDIYQIILDDNCLPDHLLNELKLLEIRTELDNVIPIQENMDLVRDGDLLISDMYLPKDIILQLLQKAGLMKQVSLIVSSGGKYSGKVWKGLSQQGDFSINTHFGDNPHSDFLMANKFKFHAELVNSSKLNMYENFLEENGFHTLALITRELRIRLPLEIRNVLSGEKSLLQSAYNIPILIMCSELIHYKVQTEKINNVLFSSRDCLYWKLYFDSIYNISNNINTHYFYTSRLARTAATPSYLRYFKTLISDSNPIIVDLCGTGQSLSLLYSKANASPQTFFLHYLDGMSQIDYTKPTRLEYVISGLHIKNDYMELMNQVSHGMVEDVIDLSIKDTFLPVFEDPDYSDNFSLYVKAISDTHNLALTTIQFYDLDNLRTELSTNRHKIPKMVEILLLDLTKKPHILHSQMEIHARQNRATVSRIKKKIDSA